MKEGTETPAFMILLYTSSASKRKKAGIARHYSNTWPKSGGSTLEQRLATLNGNMKGTQ
ncbi:hypothetical protein STEG23_015292, partial [Scotinomys teguina]